MTRGRSPVAGADVRTVLAEASDALGSSAEARWIVAHALGTTVTGLHAGLRHEAGPELRAEVRAMTDRRRRGEPLQYVLGSWAFRTLELVVDPRVLIPRPETESLVDVALEELARQARRAGGDAPTVVADLGTGSGAIALALAVEGAPTAPGLEVWATDVSPEALEVAERNREGLRTLRPDAARRVRTAGGSWFEALPSRLAGGVAVAVSNPPYVSEAEWLTLDPVVRDHEPRGALVPGPTGFEAIEHILVEGRRWLVPAGSVVVELAPGQAGRARETAGSLGYRPVGVRPDLAGRSRVLVARAPGGG